MNDIKEWKGLDKREVCGLPCISFQIKVDRESVQDNVRKWPGLQFFWYLYRMIVRKVKTNANYKDQKYVGNRTVRTRFF